MLARIKCQYYTQRELVQHYEMPLSNNAQIIQYLLQIVSEETQINHFEFASYQPIQPLHPISYYS